MKTYLCGGINGLSDADCRDWREVAKSLLTTETLDPMRRDYRGKEDESVQEIVLGDYHDIWQSAFILVNATKPSWGTAMEHDDSDTEAKDSLSHHRQTRRLFLRRNMPDGLVETVEAACEIINNWIVSGAFSEFSTGKAVNL